jgi:hypothetical protein
MLRPDYEASWAAYLATMKANDLLSHIRAWYPADEPDIKMQVSSLQTIINVLKRDTPAVDVLVTLSNLAIPSSVDSRQHGKQTVFFKLDQTPVNTDILAFDMYCAFGAGKSGVCDALWPTISSKLQSLAAFAALHPQMQVAAIPDATTTTNNRIGGASQKILNDMFLAWCADVSVSANATAVALSSSSPSSTVAPRSPKCAGMIPFVGGHWQDVTGEGAAYEGLSAMGDAVKSGDWAGSNTYIGARAKYECSKGMLVAVPCADHGGHACDAVLRPLFGQHSSYEDVCGATDRATGEVAKSLSCCNKR